MILCVSCHKCHYDEYCNADSHNAKCHLAEGPYAECLYAKSLFIECHAVGCCYAECHNAKQGKLTERED